MVSLIFCLVLVVDLAVTGGHFRIAETVTRLLMSGLVARGKFVCLVLFCITIFSTQPENSQQYLISGISGIETQNFKFGNSSFIFGIETGREMASPKWRD